MKKTILTVALLTASTAYAGGWNSPTANAGAAAGALSKSSAYAGAHSGALAAGKQTNTYLNDAPSMDRLAMPAYAPSVQSTATCIVGVNGGVTIPGVGSFAGGSGVLDKVCRYLETARITLASPNVTSENRAMANQLLGLHLQAMIGEVLEDQGVTEQASLSSYDSLMAGN